MDLYPIIIYFLDTYKIIEEMMTRKHQESFLHLNKDTKNTWIIQINTHWK